LRTLSHAHDQAAGLRRMLVRPGMRVLPIVSVLPRPEQASLCLGLATALAQLGHRTLILDASRGDVAAALGLGPRFELLQLLQGEKQFRDVVLDTPGGVRLVPAARGIQSMANADDASWRELFGAFSALSDPPDHLLLNCMPGKAHAACRAAHEGHEVILALDSSPEGVTAAYALIKAALRADGQWRFRLLFADAPPGFDSAPLCERMTAAARRFLGAELLGGGVLPRHEPAAYLSVAGRIAGWSLPEFPCPAGAFSPRAIA